MNSHPSLRTSLQTGVAIRIPITAVGEMARQKENGLPRRFAPRNDEENDKMS